MKEFFSKDEIIYYLEILGEKLKDAGVEGEMLLAGGAAMSLVHSARDLTKDIDALYQPINLIRDFATDIALEYDIAPWWLNDSVKVFLVDNPPAYFFLKLGNLKISSVTEEYLLH
jgi:hypothetical protein